MKPEPVVVLAAPHSDAARVAAMLGRHRRALPLPHLQLFHCETVGELLDLYERTQTRVADGLLRAVAALFCGGQTDAGVAAARRFLRRRGGWSTPALLDAITDAVAPRIAVFHDTAAPLQPVALDRWFRAAPDAAYLHLIRHPLAFDTAARAWCRDQLYVPPDYCDHAGDEPWLDPQLLWYRVQLTLARELDPRTQRVLRLRVEDLGHDATARLTELCEWLGWSPDAPSLEAMRHPEFGPFAGRGPQAAPEGLCRTFLDDPTFTPAVHERAQAGVLDHSQLAAEVTSMGRRLGYT